MYIRCHYYMFRPHTALHQATFMWGDHCIVYFVLSNLGTLLLFSLMMMILLLLLLNCFVGHFHSIYFSGRFSVPFYCVVHFSWVCLALFFFLYLYKDPSGAYGLIFIVRQLRVWWSGALSLWREDSSVVYNSCWQPSEQSFSGPISVVLVTMFGCLRFENSIFFAFNDSQGDGEGIRPSLHTGST
jgi:hypothetical protein